MSSSIEIIIDPKVKDLGDDFEVRRSLPQVRKRMVGPFVFWDHMGPVVLKGDKAMKVRSHPHIGLSTITYLFSGEIMHRDSLGNEQIIRPGEVNWMTAGNGIVHSERASSEKEMTLEGIQLWVALPQESEDVDPSFVHIKESELPLIKKNVCDVRLVAGSLYGEASPLPVFSKMFYCQVKAQEKGSFGVFLEGNEEAGVYVTKGRVSVEGHALEKFQMVVFKLGAKTTLEVEKDAEYMFFGGVPFGEGRHMWWNFVSSDKDKIEEAKIKWRDDLYPAVINENERIPLPKY